MCRRLLCYGDSNTYGYDPRSFVGGRYPESVRWTALLNAANWDVINRGENGRSIPRLDREIEAAVQTISGVETDVLTVMLGSNDLLQCPGLPADWPGAMKWRLTSWVSLSQMQELGALGLLMMGCIFLRRAIWLLPMKCRRHWMICYEWMNNGESGMKSRFFVGI